MEKFIARYRSLVTGVLSGFDRLVFRGSLLPLFRDGGMFFFLERAGVRLLHGAFTGEIITSFKNRPEGVRVKHWVRGNSIKMYDKAGSVLRVETTIARTKDFKVLWPAHDEPNGKLEWRPLRKGVADLHRRAQLSQRSNEAYLDALSAVEDTTPCAKPFDAVSSPVFENGHPRPGLSLACPGNTS